MDHSMKLPKLFLSEEMVFILNDSFSIWHLYKSIYETKPKQVFKSLQEMNRERDKNSQKI